jgi:hypothetical protein
LQVMKGILHKARVPHQYWNNSSIIGYEYINYDLDEVKRDYDLVSDELSRAQIALDTINNSIEFELDIW